MHNLSVVGILFPAESSVVGREETGGRGPQGVAGEKGDVGPPGSRGDTGAKGIRGIAGEKGRAGLKGAPGRAGEPGNLYSDRWCFPLHSV